MLFEALLRQAREQFTWSILQKCNLPHEKLTVMRCDGVSFSAYGDCIAEKHEIDKNLLFELMLPE